jgi:threonine/homoserine/homoserine lactone efflux protein
VPIALDQLLPFLVGSVLVTVVPGADMALVTRQVLTGGVPLAQRTIAGNMAGLLVHGVALAAGLSALLVASSTAFTAVKLAGAAYLVGLGVHTLLAARRRRPVADALDAVPGRPAISSRRAFVQGLVSTVLNPKPALFFLTFLPQFVDEERALLPQTTTFAAIHIAVGLVWLSAYARLIDRAHRVLSRPSVTAWLERVTGAVLIALGLRVAFERR